MDHFLHHTSKLGIPVEVVQFHLKRLLKQISCCAPRFLLILTAKSHSLFVEESEILERSESVRESESEILESWSISLSPKLAYSRNIVVITVVVHTVVVHDSI